MAGTRVHGALVLPSAGVQARSVRVPASQDRRRRLWRCVPSSGVSGDRRAGSSGHPDDSRAHGAWASSLGNDTSGRARFAGSARCPSRALAGCVTVVPASQSCPGWSAGVATRDRGRIEPRPCPDAAPDAVSRHACPGCITDGIPCSRPASCSSVGRDPLVRAAEEPCQAYLAGLPGRRRCPRRQNPVGRGGRTLRPRPQNPGRPSSRPNGGFAHAGQGVGVPTQRELPLLSPA